MPRPQVSGYARIAQAEEEEEEQPQDYSDDELDDPFRDPPAISTPGSHYAAIQHQPKRREHVRRPSESSVSSRYGRPRRRRTNSGVDIKAINARLERWAEEIKERFTRRRVKGKSMEEEALEIHHSVFTPPDWVQAATKQRLEGEYDDSGGRLSKMEFDDIVESVRTAIELGMHPKLISQGSSGSYFARNSGGKVVGVFKPKDEEPYASKNPKWTKWIHRNLFPFAFGRACLIPNLSYVSEAAAYVLDVQLRTNLVPYTDVVSMGSKSFYYDYWDRRAFYRGKKTLPEKMGSFQVFLKGYKGATEFFREHPWPDQTQQDAFKDAPSRKKRRRKRWAEECRPGGRVEGENESEEEGDGLLSREGSRQRQGFWTEELQQSFREQLEKLVILDYIMRNTDRGTDNWMIRVDKDTNEATIVMDLPNSHKTETAGTNGNDGQQEGYHRRNESMTPTPSAQQRDQRIARVGAIDNSLSWPWKHPDAWRSYPFGWLFLPVSLIGKPFSQRTREHFLPLLTSTAWWTETQIKLRNCFEIDADFKERMFARQMGVMKGQAWNVVETLKLADHGPLELTRRNRVCVWDDVVEIPVAMPLQRPSEEMRRQAELMRRQNRQANGRLSIAEDEEMDITASQPQPRRPGPQAASVPASKGGFDLLGQPLTPDGEREEGDMGAFRGEDQRRPEANPFNHSRQNSTQDVPTLSSTPPTTTKEQDIATPASAPLASRPGAMRSRTGHARYSLDTAPSFLRSPGAALSEHRRRFSFTLQRGFSRITGEDGYGDEENGDLGFAAVGQREVLRRKVIVERIEVVKSRVPFFTWC